MKLHRMLSNIIDRSKNVTPKTASDGNSRTFEYLWPEIKPYSPMDQSIIREWLSARHSTVELQDYWAMLHNFIQIKLNNSYESTVYTVNSLDLNHSSSSRTSIIRAKYFKPYAVHRYKIFILYQDEKKKCSTIMQINDYMMWSYSLNTKLVFTFKHDTNTLLLLMDLICSLSRFAVVFFSWMTNRFDYNIYRIFAHLLLLLFLAGWLDSCHAVFICCVCVCVWCIFVVLHIEIWWTVPLWLCEACINRFYQIEEKKTTTTTRIYRST